MSRLKPVSKTHPCPVCGGTHKCSFNVEGLLLCGRLTGEHQSNAAIGGADAITQMRQRRPSEAESEPDHHEPAEVGRDAVLCVAAVGSRLRGCHSCVARR